MNLARGQHEVAEGQASEAIRLDSKEPGAYLLRAECRRRLMRPERALADLAVAIRLDPSQPGSYVIRAEILKRRNQFDQAFADATHALTIDPRNVAAFSIRAVYRSAIGDLEAASEDGRSNPASLRFFDGGFLRASTVGEVFQPNSEDVRLRRNKK